MVADVTRHMIVKITSGRVATTAIIAPTTTNTRRNRARFLLIVVARHSSPAPRTDQRVITPLRSATRTQKIKTSIKLMTKLPAQVAPQQRALDK
jgi:hypothetical protein